MYMGLAGIALAVSTPLSGVTPDGWLDASDRRCASAQSWNRQRSPEWVPGCRIPDLLWFRDAAVGSGAKTSPLKATSFDNADNRAGRAGKNWRVTFESKAPLAGVLEPLTRVEARWKGLWYPAKITAVDRGKNTYTVLYDDGVLEDSVPRHLIRLHSTTTAFLKLAGATWILPPPPKLVSHYLKQKQTYDRHQVREYKVGGVVSAQYSDAYSWTPATVVKRYNSTHRHGNESRDMYDLRFHVGTPESRAHVSRGFESYMIRPQSAVSWSSHGPATHFSNCHPAQKKGKADGNITWVGRPENAIIELLALHVDRAFALYSVPPGKMVSFTVEDIGAHFAESSWPGHLCATKEQYSAYASTVPKGARILGWMSLEVSGATKTRHYPKSMPQIDCLSFCHNNTTPGPEWDTADCTSAVWKTYSNENSTDLPCCPVRNFPGRSELALMQMLLQKCDQRVNCFGGNFSGVSMSVTLDNDCWDRGTERQIKQNTDKYLRCSFYPKALRDYFVKRVDALREAFSEVGGASPIAAATLASAAASIQRDYPESYREVVGAVRVGMSHLKEKGAESMIGAVWWELLAGDDLEFKKSGHVYFKKPSPIDAAANVISSHFKSPECLRTP